MTTMPADCERSTGDASPTSAGRTATPSAKLALAVLVLLWAVQTPLFLAMPITNDATVYDVQARHALAGGVLYRDLFETNLPGAVWIHMLVRSVAGWSGEALRGFDLLMFAAALTLFAGHLRRVGAGARMTIWAVVAVSAFYFSSSEWLHCQRDAWMLVPALGALELRARQAARLRSRADLANEASRVFGWGVLEGVVWGLAVWIKPHVVIPAAVAWFYTAVGKRSWRLLAADLAGLLVGGLAVGALGVGWLVSTEAWPHLLATMRDWNPRYLKAGREHWTLARFVAMNVRMFPWLMIHLAAGACATWLAWRAWRSRRAPTTVVKRPDETCEDAKDRTSRAMLLASFYVTWTGQVLFVQHLFDYVYGPTVVLAIGVVCAALAFASRRAWSYAAAGALILAVFLSPLLRSDRLVAWWEAARAGGTPEMRDRLRRLGTPEWTSLEEVAQYLESQHVEQGDVLCVNDGLVHLYARLGHRPPCRFFYLEQSYYLFPEYRPQLRELIQKTPHRFVVVNLIESGFSHREAHELTDGDPLAPPPSLNTKLRGAYPWNLPIVFRAGPYVVYRVEGPKGKLLLPAPRVRRDS